MRLTIVNVVRAGVARGRVLGKGPAERLRFKLMIDGKPRPNEVEVGKNNFKPGAMPVRVLVK